MHCAAVASHRWATGLFAGHFLQNTAATANRRGAGSADSCGGHQPLRHAKPWITVTGRTLPAPAWAGFIGPRRMQHAANRSQCRRQTGLALTVDHRERQCRPDQRHTQPGIDLCSHTGSIALVRVSHPGQVQCRKQGRGVAALRADRRRQQSRVAKQGLAVDGRHQGAGVGNHDGMFACGLCDPARLFLPDRSLLASHRRTAMPITELAQILRHLNGIVTFGGKRMAQAVGQPCLAGRLGTQQYQNDSCDRHHMPPFPVPDSDRQPRHDCSQARWQAHSPGPTLRRPMHSIHP